MSHTPAMVDRVRRAILRLRFYAPEPEMYAGLDDFFESLSKSDHWEEAEEEARAAIEAMMEPTKPMIFYGMDAMARDDLEPTEDEFRAGFVAAIRAASGSAI